MSKDHISCWDDMALQDEKRHGKARFLSCPDTPYYEAKRDTAVAAMLKTDFSDLEVLEVGCGPGGNLIEIAEKHSDADITGCDTAREMFTFAKKNTAGMHNVTVKMSEPDTLPFENASFDMVLTMTTLQSIEDDADAEQIASEISRVTRGRVILFEDMFDSGIGPSSITYTLRRISFYGDLFHGLGFHTDSLERIAGPREKLDIGGFYEMQLTKEE